MINSQIQILDCEIDFIFRVPEKESEKFKIQTLKDDRKDRLRSEPFKGVFRYWYRIVHRNRSGKRNIEQLMKDEAEVFGSTKKKSSVVFYAELLSGAYKKEELSKGSRIRIKLRLNSKILKDLNFLSALTAFALFSSAGQKSSYKSFICESVSRSLGCSLAKSVLEKKLLEKRIFSIQEIQMLEPAESSLECLMKDEKGLFLWKARKNNSLEIFKEARKKLKNFRQFEPKPIRRLTKTELDFILLLGRKDRLREILNVRNFLDSELSRAQIHELIQ